MQDLFEFGENRINDPREYSPVTLAYIGDSVYELFVRTFLLKEPGLTSFKLHRNAVKYVSAASQAAVLTHIYETLDEEERNIVRRAKNQKPATMPKNAAPDDYMLATAFEALIGFHYIRRDYRRLRQILQAAVEKRTDDTKG